MYTLVIGKSSSKNFNTAVDIACSLGGEFDGSKITLSIDEEMKAYQTFYPLFKLNVLSWTKTRAYHNGHQVSPYRFMFLMEHKRKTFYAQVLEQLEGDFNIVDFLDHEQYNNPCLYYKREGNRFYFRSEKKAFFLDLKGKLLYDFVDQFDIGDIVNFE